MFAVIGTVSHVAWMASRSRHTRTPKCPDLLSFHPSAVGTLCFTRLPLWTDVWRCVLDVIIAHGSSPSSFLHGLTAAYNQLSLTTVLKTPHSVAGISQTTETQQASASMKPENNQKALEKWGCGSYKVNWIFRGRGLSCPCSKWGMSEGGNTVVARYQVM